MALCAANSAQGRIIVQKKLLQDLDTADDGQGLFLVLGSGDDAHDHKYQQSDADEPADDADDGNDGKNAVGDADQNQQQTLIQVELGTLLIAGQIGDQPEDDADVSKNTGKFLIKNKFPPFPVQKQ